MRDKDMPTLIKTIILSISLITVSAVTQASLITNGSFERTTFDDYSTSIGSVFKTDLRTYNTKSRAWDVFYNLPGWETTYGNGIELQKNVVTRSYDGFHHVELDSHPRGASNAVMTQTLTSLTVGADYLLEYFYKPRTNSTNDNGINVFWYDSAVDFNLNMKAAFVSDGTRHITPNWVKQIVSFTAKAQTMDLSFASFGKQNTLGGLIDNVSLVKVVDVSEPPTYLFLLALAGLLVRRQYKK
jgi:hypothetical protein